MRRIDEWPALLREPTKGTPPEQLPETAEPILAEVAPPTGTVPSRTG